MKIKNIDIFNVKEPLQRLSQGLMTVKLSFAVFKLAKELAEINTVITETREKLIKQYGSEDPAKQNYWRVEQFLLEPVDSDSNQMKQVDNPNWEPFAEAFNELMEEEVEIEYEKLTLPETLDISPADIALLSVFFEVPE